MVRDHQPGEAVFRSILPEDIDWKPFPAFPPSARLAVLVGEPTQAGPYVIRVKVPSGVKLMPHKHPEDRIYTVMSGVFYIGLGDRFDGDKVRAYPPGSVIDGTSTGQSPVSTSLRSRPLGRWASNTGTLRTIRETKLTGTPPAEEANEPWLGRVVGQELQSSCRRADAVAQAGDTGPLGAMLAAEERPFLLEPVAHDADAASLAFRRQRMDRTFKAVEGMVGTVHAHLERLVVVVPAGFTSGHEDLAPVAWGLRL